MNKRTFSIHSCIALLAIVPLTLHAEEGSTYYEYAEVIDVRPVYVAVQVATPRQQCWDERIIRTTTPGRRSYTGVILGGIAGGALGSEVTHGRHKEWGTAAGTVLGASIGNDIHNAQQARNATPVTSVERRCETVEVIHVDEQLAGYRVEYVYEGKTYRTRMDRDPGERVRVSVAVRVAE